MPDEINRQEQRRLEREQREREKLMNPSSSKPKTNFSFDWRILIPVIVLILAGVEVFVFSNLQPLNYVFAIIIFIASAYMFVQYFNKDKLQAEVFVPKKAYNAAMDENEKQAVSGVVGKMDLFKGIEQSSSASSSGKDSFNLDDFLKSFPEDSSKPKKRFAEVMEDSSPQPEKRVEDKLMQLAKQKEQEKKSSQEPVRSFQKTETQTTDTKTVSFKDLKENTLKELKDLAKKKKQEEK